MQLPQSEFQHNKAIRHGYSKHKVRQAEGCVMINVTTEDDTLSSTFVVFGASNDSVKKPTSTTDKIRGLCVSAENNPLYDYSSGQQEPYTAGSSISFIRQMEFIDFYCNVDILQGEQLYIDIANSDATKKMFVTNVATNNLLIPNAIATSNSFVAQSGKKFVTFNLNIPY